MKSQSSDMDTVIAKACGTSTAAHSTPSPSATQTVIAVPSKASEVLTTSARTTSTVPASSSTVTISSSPVSNTTSSVQTISSSSSSSSVPPSSSSVPATSSSALVNEAPVIASPTSSFTPTTPTAPPPPTTSSSFTPEQTSSSTPPPAPSSSSSSNPGSGSGSSSGSGSTSGSDIDQYLSTHNSVRAQHGASPLTWSDDLAGKAQQWANGCDFKHSGGSLGPFGENLAAGTGDSYGIASAVKSWTDEASQYDPTNPQASHFTQVVWKGSTQVGCAVQLCDGIFSASFGKAKFYVCEYSPQGNIIGQFAQNVQV
ncbi:PR-1-like protein [Gloeophyllum trabeum ATCC 11539]|uniref:PR-1-like protein n=1 Tax=Gloeophyllum trabeum (strain ATCC 11539 / FP-39264 / Madison 617) TaxID=670483 RepID=S7QN59_GLOTA|nr:PR-1-like protein [Gloeophyllum trabeum ATCC 11539]EPQ60852.1 PR-1-like protein [Gloeophyllum trabeum ATCC 11539]